MPSTIMSSWRVQDASLSGHWSLGHNQSAHSLACPSLGLDYSFRLAVLERDSKDGVAVIIVGD